MMRVFLGFQCPRKSSSDKKCVPDASCPRITANDHCGGEYELAGAAALRHVALPSAREQLKKHTPVNKACRGANIARAPCRS